MKKILLVAAGVFVVLIIIGAASGSESKSEKIGENTQTPQPTKSQMETENYKVGDQIKSGDFVISVNDIRESKGTEYIKPKDGSVYIIPNVTIQNNGSEKANVSTLLSMYIKDEEGNKYTPTMTPDATGKVDGELLSGDKIKGDVGFEIPVTAKGLKFYYNPEWLTGESIAIDLD